MVSAPDDDLYVNTHLSAENAVEDLLDLVRSANALPIGFIGSGFSRRYLKTPDWRGLLEYLASLTDEPLNRYLTQRQRNQEDFYPDSASEIASVFRTIWWKNAEYQSQRNDFSEQIGDISDPLKLQVAQYIKTFKIADDPQIEKELQSFQSARFQSFITTNYDSLLEELLPDYVCYHSQSEALFSPTYEMGEIYKIHGSIANFPSITLTREDYHDYRERNPYLTAKLLTYFVENPVLFFGYSLSDPHVQALLTELTQCLTDVQLSTLNDRLIFIGRKSEDRPEELQRIPFLIEGHTFYVRQIGLEDWSTLFMGLSDLPYHFAPRVLRRLRESVYSAAENAETMNRVRLVDIDDDTALDTIETVVGVNIIDRIATTGYSGVGLREYLIDLLGGARSLQSNLLAEHSFKSINHSYVPVFYFERLASSMGDTTDYSNHRKIEKWKDKQSKLSPYYVKAGSPESRLHYAELRDADISNLRKSDATLLLEEWNVEDIRLLRDDLLLSVTTESTIETYTAKKCSLFDRLVYGGEFKGDRAVLWETLNLDPELLQS